MVEAQFDERKMTDRPVVIVTGASRGAGRGIAQALGGHGCIVYVTGRSEVVEGATLEGTIHATAQAVSEAGGTGIAVRCDHADDAQVKALIERVIADQGRIDILVNNACAIHEKLSTSYNFWEKPLEVGDMINVGLRSGYVASWYAAPHLVRQGRGLIVFTSSPGAEHYCFGPAYGAHKAGMDKMAFDMAIDFKDAGVDVAAVSIWMGALRTQRLLDLVAAEPEKYQHLDAMLETPEYTGHAIWGLFNDPALMDLSGSVLIGAEVAKGYGIADLNGQFPPSVRDLHGARPPVFGTHKVK